MTLSTQATPYGAVLSNEQLYRAEIARISRLTRAQEQALVEQARGGDAQAGERLINHLLSGVECIASRYYRRYGRSYKRLEYLDLIQEGSKALVEKLEIALGKANPCAYLLAAADGAIHHYCFQHRSSITTPLTHGASSIRVESLDAPRCDEQGPTLLDTLAEVQAEPTPSVDAPRESETALRQAVDTLPRMQRTVVVRHFGLHDAPAEEIAAIQRALYGNRRHKMACVHKRLALTALRRTLALTYPQYS